MRNLKRNVVLVGVVLALVVPVCVMAKVTKSVNKDYAVLTPPETNPPFPDASGDIKLIEPNGNVELIVKTTVEGLGPNAQYAVVVFGVEYGEQIPGDLYTDDNGQGACQIKKKADQIPLGSHTFIMVIYDLVGPVLETAESFGIGIEEDI
jgi:hypothetical protein